MNNIVPFQDVERMASAIAKSNLFGMKTPEQALTMMLIAQAEGKHPATAAVDYDIIQGRPAKKPKAMLRDFISMGGKVTWVRYDDQVCTATFTPKGNDPVTITWDLDRAKKAGLADKQNWKNYPRQMLRARVTSEGLSMVCPEATGGLYTVEEVQDMGREEKPMKAVVQTVEPKQVGLPMGSEDYVIPFGTDDFKGKKLKEVEPEALEQAVLKLVDFEASKGREITGEKKAFVSNVREYLKKLDAERQEKPSPAEGAME